MAIDMGADALELDLRRSRDGVPIVIHDEDLKRIAGIDRKVCELDSIELRNIVIGGKEHIPTLEEILSEFGNKVPLFIEIKDEDLEETVINKIYSFGATDNVLVISFNYRILSRIRELSSKLDVGLLTYRYPIPIAEAIKLKAFAILPRFNLVTPNVVKEIHSKKLKVYTWTVNDASIALRMVGYGIDGIATDNLEIKNVLLKQQKLTKCL